VENVKVGCSLEMIETTMGTLRNVHTVLGNDTVGVDIAE